MMKDDDKTARKTSLLIAEVLELGNRVLPPVHAVRLQVRRGSYLSTSSPSELTTSSILPRRLFLACSPSLPPSIRRPLDSQRAMRCSLSAITTGNVESGSLLLFSRRRQRWWETTVRLRVETGALRYCRLPPFLLTPSSCSANSTASASASHAADAPPSLSALRQISTSRLTSALQLDDTTFRLHLLESGVLSTKDHTKWNFEVVRDLLEGPLRNPKRLEEATRGSKWVKRVVGFYWPFGGRYGELSKAEEVRRACSFLLPLCPRRDGVSLGRT